MELDKINEPEFFQLISSEEMAISFCQINGLLLKNPMCCSKLMMLRKRNTIKTFGYFYRCNNKNCRKEISIRKNSFFAGSHLKIRQILFLIHYFVRDKQKQIDLKFDAEIISNSTIVDWKNFCREVCTEYFFRNPVVLGGEGVIVQIDESSLVKRKYDRGRIVKTQWVFGAYQPSTKEGFLFAVQDTKRDTLLPIIKEYIRPGTLIMSDCAAVYNSLPLEGYSHLTVNHKNNFRDPITGATTNHVESQWQKVKGKSKDRYGTHRSTLDSHLGEFMWRQKFGNSMQWFISHIKDIYPLE